MSDPAVRVDGLGKRYSLGHRQKYKTLRESLNGTVQSVAHRLNLSGGVRAWNESAEGDPEYVWALSNVTFEVQRGEVLGIIGRNGSGKSTLLKILSRITYPTKGSAEIRGHVGSLLEVGTGFHPELTGRENIYLNGAILGMRKSEIDRKFDEIVSFAEVERFMDTPVKHYSSGMYTRLAFSVAAHLEPEILAVDEVLAVGDAAFQKKCLGKMGKVAKEGRTVLFVSHNMVAVEDLCSRAIWLSEGKIEEVGPTGHVVSKYLQTSLSSLSERIWENITTAPGNDQVRLHRARARPANGLPSGPLTVRTPFVVEVEYWNNNANACLRLNLQLYNEQGILIFETSPVDELMLRPLSVGLYRDVCRVPADLMNDGMHRVVLQVVNARNELIHQEEDILVFEIRDATDMRLGLYGEWEGVVRPILNWSRESVDG